MSCKHCKRIVKRAEELGATPVELGLFQSVFFFHPYTEFRNDHPFWEGAVVRLVKKEYTDKKGRTHEWESPKTEGGELNVDKLLNKIRELADTLSTEGMREYFLEAIWEDINRLNSFSNWGEELALFYSKWKTYFPETPRKAPAQQEPNTKVLALRTYFLYWAGYLPKLDEGKRAGLAAIAEKEGVSPGSLVNAWYAIKRNSDKNPLKLSILERVLPTLSDFPEAQKLAEEELEQLKKKSNPRK
ncbi:MAG: hypothetical protein WA004_21410 [Saprospiraceae bacterium]